MNLILKIYFRVTTPTCLKCVSIKTCLLQHTAYTLGLILKYNEIQSIIMFTFLGILAIIIFITQVHFAPTKTHLQAVSELWWH